MLRKFVVEYEGLGFGIERFTLRGEGLGFELGCAQGFPVANDLVDCRTSNVQSLVNSFIAGGAAIVVNFQSKVCSAP